MKADSSSLIQRKILLLREFQAFMMRYENLFCIQVLWNRIILPMPQEFSQRTMNKNKTSDEIKTSGFF